MERSGASAASGCEFGDVEVVLEIVVEVVVVVWVSGDPGAGTEAATSLPTMVEHAFGGESKVDRVPMTGTERPKGPRAWCRTKKLATGEDIVVFVVWNCSKTVYLFPNRKVL